MCVLLCTATSSTATVSLMMHAGREREAGRTELFQCYKNWGNEQPHRHKVQSHMSVPISLWHGELQFISTTGTIKKIICFKFVKAPKSRRRKNNNKPFLLDCNKYNQYKCQDVPANAWSFLRFLSLWDTINAASTVSSVVFYFSFAPGLWGLTLFFRFIDSLSERESLQQLC